MSMGTADISTDFNLEPKQFRNNFYFWGQHPDKKPSPTDYTQVTQEMDAGGKTLDTGCDKGRDGLQCHLRSSSVIFLHPHAIKNIYWVRVCMVIHEGWVILNDDRRRGPLRRLQIWEDSQNRESLVKAEPGVRGPIDKKQSSDQN